LSIEGENITTRVANEKRMIYGKMGEENKADILPRLDDNPADFKMEGSSP
jgi:hypothetical protein